MNETEEKICDLIEAAREETKKRHDRLRQDLVVIDEGLLEMVQSNGIGTKSGSP